MNTCLIAACDSTMSWSNLLVNESTLITLQIKYKTHQALLSYLCYTKPIQLPGSLYTTQGPSFPHAFLRLSARSYGQPKNNWQSMQEIAGSKVPMVTAVKPDKVYTSSPVTPPPPLPLWPSGKWLMQMSGSECSQEEIEHTRWREIVI